MPADVPPTTPLLDIAQDFLFDELARNGLFDDGRLVFKGGTSLRKHRLGNLGRFSTDLDFAAPNPDLVLDACEIIDGARIGGFTFALSEPRDDARHWTLTVNHPELGTPRIGASVEFARRAVDRRRRRPPRNQATRPRRHPHPQTRTRLPTRLDRRAHPTRRHRNLGTHRPPTLQLPRRPHPRRTTLGHLQPTRPTRHRNSHHRNRRHLTRHASLPAPYSHRAT